MDNGEIAILVSLEKADPAGGRIFEPNIAFSRDGGAETGRRSRRSRGRKADRSSCTGWGGRLSFVTETFDGGRQQRFFSSDHGRSWKERADHPATQEGRGFSLEGNG